MDDGAPEEEGCVLIPLIDELVDALDAARRVDSDGGARLYAVLRPYVNQRARRRGVSPGLLNDLANDVALSVVGLMNQHQVSISIAKQIPTIVQRRIDDHWRKEDHKFAPTESAKLMALVDEHGAEIDAFEAFELDDELQPLRGALEQLRKSDPVDYEAIQASLNGENVAGRLAQVRGRPVTAAAARKATERARKKLAQLMGLEVTTP